MITGRSATGCPVKKGSPMVFVKRDNNSRIVSVSLVETAEHRESLPLDSPELGAFTSILASGQEKLAITDLDLVRVLEDLIDLLFKGDVIRFTDFPQPAQEKLLARRSMRSSLHSLKLLDEDEWGGMM
jgi:hypothetical protein